MAMAIAIAMAIAMAIAIAMAMAITIAMAIWLREGTPDSVSVYLEKNMRKTTLGKK